MTPAVAGVVRIGLHHGRIADDHLAAAGTSAATSTTARARVVAAAATAGFVAATADADVAGTRR
jgi:hypothetical protein